MLLQIYLRVVCIMSITTSILVIMTKARNYAAKLCDRKFTQFKAKALHTVYTYITYVHVMYE